MIRHTWRQVRVSLVREGAPARFDGLLTMSGDEQAAGLARAVIGDDPREHFLAIYLDTRHRAIGVHVVSIGTADVSLVHPREVFGPALMLHATALIVVHNHPSGDPCPSAEDKRLTERLRDAGTLLGIELLDHLVLGSERFFSFADEGYKVMP
jgi:DNA repair protein RadC